MSGMHLEKPYLTTTRYNIKSKKNRSKKLQAAQDEHEAWLKKMGVGKTKPPVDKKGRRVGIYEIPDYSTGPRMTSDRVAANGVARKSNTYTGDEIMGIGTMHKSNAVPIRKDSKDAAKDLASMRR
jgi:hypothetical protein